MTLADLNRPEGIADVIWDTLTNEFYTARYRWQLSQRLRTPLLDVGCGQGYSATLMAKQLGVVRACDIDEEYVNITAWTAKVNDAEVIVECGSAYELPCADAAFNTVTCTEMIEHLDDPFAALVEMVRVLAPGGALVISCPAHGAMGPDKFAEHVQDFDRSTLLGLIELAGCDVIEWRLVWPFQCVAATKR